MEMFLRNCWYMAGFSNEITRKPIARTLLATPVLFFRTEAGEAVATDNVCPHRFAPLDQGKLIGDTIQCRYHGLRFDKSGACVSVSSGEAPPPRARLRVFPLVERYGMLWIWMGDKEAVAPDRIPDFAYLEDDRFAWADAYLYVAANYQLVVDNLLDLSHGEFLHPALASEGWSARNHQTVVQEDDTITVHNVAEDDNLIPLLRQLRPELNPIGRWYQQERWNAPGNMKLAFEYTSHGLRHDIPSGHFTTPETATSSHYWIRSGHAENRNDPAYTEMYRAGTTAIFRDEDVPMLEAQQKILDTDDLMSRHPAILKSDGPAIRARRLLARMIREEQAMTGESIAAE